MKSRPTALLSLLCLLVILFGIIYGLIWLRRSNDFAIDFIQIHGTYRFVEPQQIKQAMLPYLSHVNFFSLRIGALAHALAEVPAVAHIRLERKWPHTLIVHIEERQPIAVWNDVQLLDKTGAIFSAPKTPGWALLPHFIGQKAKAKEMIARYQKMQMALFQDRLVVKTCALSAIGDWQLQLIPGDFWLYLGNRFLDQRLMRFIGSYDPLLKSNPKHKIAYVDLRYPQGMAVRWISS